MEAFEGGREEGTLTAFVQLFRPTPAWEGKKDKILDSLAGAGDTV